MISIDALSDDLLNVLLEHLKNDDQLELMLTLHIRPSAASLPHNNGNDVPDGATLRMTVDALESVQS